MTIKKKPSKANARALRRAIHGLGASAAILSALADRRDFAQSIIDEILNPNPKI